MFFSLTTAVHYTVASLGGHLDFIQLGPSDQVNFTSTSRDQQFYKFSRTKYTPEKPLCTAPLIAHIKNQINILKKEMLIQDYPVKWS